MKILLSLVLILLIENVFAESVGPSPDEMTYTSSVLVYFLNQLCPTLTPEESEELNSNIQIIKKHLNLDGTNFLTDEHMSNVTNSYYQSNGCNPKDESIIRESLINSRKLAESIISPK